MKIAYYMVKRPPVCAVRGGAKKTILPGTFRTVHQMEALYMAIKDLVVHIDNSQTCEKRLQAAIQIARDHDAHLTGLYVMKPIAELMMYPIEPILGPVREQIQKPLQEHRDAARAMFDAVTNSAGIVAEWRESEGQVIGSLNISARYTDLVILGQHQPSDIADQSYGVADRLVVGCGRPCLVIPYIGAPEAFGKQVLVAWNAGRESIRAVNDALPMLQRAEKVRVVAVDPPAGKRGEGDIPCADICHHLARHGVKAEAVSLTAPDIDVGNFLLSHAANLNADMIVMGAYGHSRLSEMVLGGVTRAILDQMTVPVFMSH